jgi:predicted O-linked N-acetylglucosamine transferase (SPINDLY family)
VSNADKVARLRQRADQAAAAGRSREAEELYGRILDLHRTDRPARHMMAVMQLRQGRAQEALGLLAALCAEAPDNVDIRTHHGLAQQALGRHDAALADFDQALALSPGAALVLLYRGDALAALGRAGDAIASYDRLIQIAPRFDEPWFARAAALWQLGLSEEALSSYRQCLARNPGRFDAAFNIGTSLLKLDRYDEALAAFEQAQALAPAHPYLPGAMAAAVLGGCDLERWTGMQGRLTDAVRRGQAVVPPLTFLPFCDDGDLRRACSAAFVADRVPHGPAPLWTGERYDHRPIRIAYLSGDFHQHATSELIAGLIERHDRAQFRVTGLSFSKEDDSAIRKRIVAAFDDFRDVRGLSDREVAQWLRDKEFDIAVDLKGHTEGSRPAILAHRPCPVQVNWLGYPGTIGADFLDYIVGDPVVLPFAHQAWYSEKIMHLPHSYQSNDQRAISEEPQTRIAQGLPENGFVFCCFNAGWKINPGIFDIWMRLLACVPGSVLWLLDDNNTARRNLRQAARKSGVDPDRLVFAPRVQPAVHLARHRLADLFLDTSPYNAHTTASDALLACVPLVTCMGSQFDGRVAASLLTTIGLPELITGTLEDYEALALDLARDPQRLAGLRARLAENRLSSPLFDIGRFCAAIEAAWLRMVNSARAGLPPESFTIAP